MDFTSTPSTGKGNGFGGLSGKSKKIESSRAVIQGV